MKHRVSGFESVFTLELDCPTCGASTGVVDRFTPWGVPSDVEHIKVRCAVGHRFTMLTDSLRQPTLHGVDTFPSSSPRSTRSWLSQFRHLR
jgi:hypothetical protein